MTIKVPLNLPEDADRCAVRDALDGRWIDASCVLYVDPGDFPASALPSLVMAAVEAARTVVAKRTEEAALREARTRRLLEALACRYRRILRS